MTFVIVFLHVVVSIALIAIVLLQSGKGAEMGASFGAGGSQSVFGAGGGNTFMSKLTTGAAVIFMLTSLVLAHLSGTTGSSSIMSSKSAPKQAAPATPAAPAQPGAPVQQTAPAMPANPAGAPQQAPAAPAK
ncbi:MAG TPA: preprotein translocase subunit SecG [Geobacteraceae bacterium]